MKIEELASRKRKSHGNRYNPDPFYQSKEWRNTRIRFLMSKSWQQLPPINGKPYDNGFCVECWKQGKIVKTHTIDHVDRKRAGGDKTDFRNLQGLCLSHHNAKSAAEKNELYKK